MAKGDGVIHSRGRSWQVDITVRGIRIRRCLPNKNNALLLLNVLREANEIYRAVRDDDASADGSDSSAAVDK